MRLITSVNRSGKGQGHIDPAPAAPRGSVIAFDPEASTIGSDVVLLLRASEDDTFLLTPEEYPELGNDYISLALLCYSDKLESEGCYAAHTVARVIGLSSPGSVGGRSYYTLLMEPLYSPGQAPGPSYMTGTVKYNVNILNVALASDPVVIRPSYDRNNLEPDVGAFTPTLWANLEGYGFGCQMLDVDGRPYEIYPIKLRPAIGAPCSLSLYDRLAVAGGVPCAGVMQLTARKGADTAETRDKVVLFAPVVMEPINSTDWNLYWSCLSIDPTSGSLSSQLMIQGNAATRYDALADKEQLFQFDVPFWGTPVKSTP